MSKSSTSSGGGEEEAEGIDGPFKADSLENDSDTLKASSSVTSLLKSASVEIPVSESLDTLLTGVLLGKRFFTYF